MTRYMGDYYWTRNNHDLAVLRSKKHNRLQKLQREAMSYFNKIEMRTLREQIQQIDTVLAARSEQNEILKDL